jgi:undecaprenyl-diphosphatase
VIVGLVQGITEWLPVSSFGHVLLTLRAMGFGTSTQNEREAANALAICLQAGAIVAVLGLYLKRLKQMGTGLIGKDLAGRRLATNVIVAFIPAGAVGFLFKHQIEGHLFNLWLIAPAWIVGGLAIIVVTWMRGGRRARSGLDIDHLDWARALIIGWVQCLAFWPGTSRSLVTIVSALAVGMSVGAAVEFSFILGLVTLTAATVFKALGKIHGDFVLDGAVVHEIRGYRLMLHDFGAVNLILAFGMAALSAAITIKWLLSYIKRYSLAVFGWYRVALGVGVAILLIAGWLKN